MNGILRGALVATFLAVLLTALILGSIGVDGARDTRSLQAIDSVMRADTALQRDVLLARAGLLRDYDPLVAESDRMNTSLERLRADLRRDHLDDAPARSLMEAADAEQTLIEQFKSDQALARNSLAYLPLLTAQAIADDGGNAPPIQALSQSVLQLILDNTPEAVASMQRRTDELARVVPSSPGDATTLRQLARHARLLERLLPQVDGLLHEMAAMPMPALTRTVRAQIEARTALLQRQAARFRIALYVVSLLLLALVIRFFVNLRQSRLELEALAAGEHMIARISTRFVACEPERIADALERALAEIGQQTGFDRVTILCSEPERLLCWARNGEPPPAGLGRMLLDMAEEADPVDERAGNGRTGDEPLHVMSLASAPGPAARSLTAAGTRGWAAVRLRQPEPMIGLLAFERVRLRARWPRSGIKSLRPIAHVIEEAMERERAAAERDTLQARLRQAQRLEVAGQLASGLAHNFNNIIGAVLGHAEMVAECLASGASPLGHVQEIRRAGDRASELVENMLNFGRKDLPRDSISMSVLAAETVSLLRVSLPPDIALLVKDEAAGAVVVGRPAELQQVMLNLMRNAVQAVSGTGMVTLRLARAEVAAQRDLKLGSLMPGAHVMLSVSDTGGGMDRATLGRIFEPFFTTRPAGTGLGLATVADIVRDHGGGIEVRSTPRAGSLFEVWLPCGVSPQAFTPARRGAGEIVLFVEPDRERLLKIEDTLAALGYEPAAFTSHALALAAFVQMPSRYDIALISAAAAREGHGQSFVLSLRAMRLDLPIAVIGDASDAAQLLQGTRHAGLVVSTGLGASSLSTALYRLLNETARIHRLATKGKLSG